MSSPKLHGVRSRDIKLSRQLLKLKYCNRACGVESIVVLKFPALFALSHSYMNEENEHKELLNLGGIVIDKPSSIHLKNRNMLRGNARIYFLQQMSMQCKLLAVKHTDQQVLHLAENIYNYPTTKQLVDINKKFNLGLVDKNGYIVYDYAGVKFEFDEISRSLFDKSFIDASMYDYKSAEAKEDADENNKDTLYDPMVDTGENPDDPIEQFTSDEDANSSEDMSDSSASDNEDEDDDVVGQSESEGDSLVAALQYSDSTKLEEYEDAFENVLAIIEQDKAGGKNHYPVDLSNELVGLMSDLTREVTDEERKTVFVSQPTCSSDNYNLEYYMLLRHKQLNTSTGKFNTNVHPISAERNLRDKEFLKSTHEFDEEDEQAEEEEESFEHELEYDESDELDEDYHKRVRRRPASPQF